MLPNQTKVMRLLEPYLGASNDIGFAIGTVCPADSPVRNTLYAGRLVNDAGDPLTLDGGTCFELASVSKTFCATLFAYYAAQNPSLREAIVRSYHPQNSPSLAPQFDVMPLVSLANYTSGLPEDNHPAPPPSPATTPRPLPHPYTVAEMYNFLSTITWPLPATPGGTYSYSNLAFSLLGESLPVAMNLPQSYSGLLETNVLGRLGMSSTVMFDQILRDRLPRGYGPDGQPAEPGSKTFPAYYGAGGAVSTPTDVMAWLQFNMGMTSNPVLTSLLPALQQPSTTVLTKNGSKLGLGWFLTSVPTLGGPSLNTVWKDGGYAGYRSYVTFLASDQPGTIPSKAGVFVLTNSAADTEGIARFVLCLLRGYLPAPPGSGVDR